MSDANSRIRVTSSQQAPAYSDREGLPAAAMANVQGFTLHVCDEESIRRGDPHIFFFQRAYQQVMDHLSSDMSREHGGLLLGYEIPTETPTVWIVHALPALNARGTRTRVELDHDVQREWDRQEEQLSSLGLKRIGWYHSHPNISIFLSPWDLDACKEFNRKTQVALVVDPVNKRGGFFSRGAEGYRDNSPQGFWEVHDVRPDSIVNWKNLVCISNEPEPRDQAAADDESFERPVAHANPPAPDDEQPSSARQTQPAESRSGYRGLAGVLGNRVVMSGLVLVNILLSFALVLAVMSIDRQVATLPRHDTGPPQYSLSPQKAEVSAGQRIGFQVTANGAKEAEVAYELIPKTGSIENDGTYTAPEKIESDQIVTVRALRPGTNQVLGESTVRLIASGTPIAIQPDKSGPVGPGQSVTMKAEGAAAGKGVKWAVEPASAGSIKDGVFTAASRVGVPTTATVIATSVADPSKSARLQIQLQPKPEVAVRVNDPKEVALLPGQKHQFQASVINAANSKVRWEGRFINRDTGEFTAPAQVQNDEDVVITAISLEDSTKRAQAVVKLKKPPSPGGTVAVSVKPPSNSLAAGQKMQFTASVTGTDNHDVDWSVVSGPGKFAEANGTYVAPATVDSPTDVVVRATSRADKTKSKEARFRVLPVEVKFAFEPDNYEMRPGETKRFVVQIAGLANTDVEWKIEPEDQGKITGNGEYTAPEKIGSETTVAVIATSKADRSRTARATVQLKPAEN